MTAYATTPVRRMYRARKDRGAALYVALIMLILLAMLGIVGMQVAGIQERMASSYRAVNRAFQNAEAVVREAECAIEEIANRSSAPGCTVISEANIHQMCEEGFDPAAWGELQDLTSVPAVSVRQIDRCVQVQGPLDMGVQPESERPFPIYRITAYAADDASNASSSAVVDTVFKL